MSQTTGKKRRSKEEREAARAAAALLVGRAFRCPDGLVRWITGLSTLDNFSLRWLDEREGTWFSGGTLRIDKWEGGEEVRAPQLGETFRMCGARGMVEERTVTEGRQ
jgi:hypothetical protein